MRHLLENERPVVAFLFDLADIIVDLDALQVRPMPDGGMGSLAIAPFETARKFGSSPAECHFHDVDGAPVSAVLNLDQNGEPFEIDVWRLDFAPTARWPSEAEISAGPPNPSLKPKPLRHVE